MFCGFPSADFTGTPEEQKKNVRMTTSCSSQQLAHKATNPGGMSCSMIPIWVDNHIVSIENITSRTLPVYDEVKWTLLRFPTIPKPNHKDNDKIVSIFIRTQAVDIFRIICQ